MSFAHQVHLSKSFTAKARAVVAQLLREAQCFGSHCLQQLIAQTKRWIPAACRRSVWQYERRGSASRYPLQHHTDRSSLIHRCLRMQLDQIIGWSLLWAIQTANVNLQGCQSCSQAVASEIGASCPQCLRQASHLSLRPPQMHEVHSICFSASCRQRWPILWRLPPRFWVSSIARGPSQLLCSHWACRHETML